MFDRKWCALVFFHRWERVCFSLPRRIEEWVSLLVRARSKLLDRLERACPWEKGAILGEGRLVGTY